MPYNEYVVTASQFDIPSLTQLSVTGWDRLQLEVAHMGYFRSILLVVDN